MTEQTAAQLLNENLHAVYGYAFSRLRDKEQTEDLAAEIVLEILSSVQTLKNDDAFWAWAWKIADHTLRRFLRRSALASRTVEWSEENVGMLSPAPDADYIRRESEADELRLLRRELALLKKTHREICVAYYVDGKSCAQIARERNVSTETVKYYLFTTRKLLKEGIAMTRTIGEKSYRPGTFRPDFWGDWNHYGDLFKRKLPGSVLLAAYDAPMTAQELSLELGVAMPYLEDELEILEAAGVLKKTGEKYRTNIVILTDAYEKEFAKNTASLYPETARSVFHQVAGLLPRIREMDFQGNGYDDNRLLFALVNLALFRGYDLARKRSPMGAPKPLALGGNGWVFGYDNDYANHHFLGIAGEVWNREKTAWFSAENYRILAKTQRYEHTDFLRRAEAVCDAILGRAPDRDNPTLPGLIGHHFIRCEDDRLSAGFPVFSKDVYDGICRLLTAASEETADCMIRLSDRAETILSGTVPAAVREQCGDIAKIHHRLDAAALLLEDMIEEKLLTVPEGEVPLCMWGVKI